MTLFKQFTTGLNLAVHSFKLFFTYKELWVYSAIAAITLFGLGSVPSFYAMLTQPLQAPAIYKPLITGGSIADRVQGLTLEKPIVIVLLIALAFIQCFITTFVAVCFIYHANRLIRNQEASYKHSFIVGYRKIGVILVWTLIITILMLAIPEHEWSLQTLGILLTFVSLLAKLAISIVTFLVIPLLAIEDMTVPQAVIQSAKTTLRHIVAFFGGNCLIWGLAIIATILAFLAAYLATINTDFSLSVRIPIMLIALAFSTYILNGAMLFELLFFDTFYKKKIEEFFIAEHDLTFY